MSSLNQAFLKAYHKSTAVAARGEASAASPQQAVAPTTNDAPPAPHVPLPTAATPRAPLSLPEPTAPLALPPRTVAVKPKPLTPPVPVTIVDAAHPGVKAPHARFASAPARQARPAAAANDPSPASVDTPSLEARPMVLPMFVPSHSWRPVFEISSFVWPEMIGTMLAAGEAPFRAAAAELIDACRRHRKLVAIAGASASQGCTATTLALARALAQLQQKVAIVDAHFASPQLADSLGVMPQVGWEEHLSGGKPLTEVLVESLEDRVTLLPLRQPPAADWRVSEARLKASFDELRRHFDLVLIDSGPLGDPQDRRHLLSWAAPCRVDRALVVRDVRSLDGEQIATIEKRLQECGIAQWNFVDNFAA
ncbi:MAG: hypothetical protein HYX69_02080 [Planctomycetia bacterium]|nr:hypothetical protein [Planctomycetia bacterium]